MIFYGVPQYQLGRLRLSSIQKTKESFSLLVSTRLHITLHAFVVNKLRIYLEARGSNSDIIFLEPPDGKPVGSSSFRHLFTELNYALHLKCSPRYLHNTYLHLRMNAETRDQLISYLVSNTFSQPIASPSHE